ncbi:hypothetical protein [Streptomyces indicus]|uniref:Uncharacterized protein n=1 Tax=Streptomyces indicus TaxID=417292 RepID=A0A1G9J010_9ACTN|nr:hypothetical protein [Streptomyces indicus]SDL30848.1 hypothetical protein SAMN05421806_12645 [Streptomyces indicus]
MNGSPGRNVSADAPSVDQVQVVLGECSAADAEAVFTVLREQFPSDRDPGGPLPAGSRTPAVWIGTFAAAHRPHPGPDVRLEGPVTAQLQGGPVAVARLREALEAAFAVADLGSASGDQEVDAQLRLS